MECDGWRDDMFANEYRCWLSNTMDPRGEFHILFDYLHDTRFEWVLDRDEGRASDGRRLRERFAWEADIPMPLGSLDWPCSFLEFVAGLAYAIEDRIMYDPDTPEGPLDWFWMLMHNMELDHCTDSWMRALGPIAERNVSDKVEFVMYRKYGYSGRGGLFPLENPRRDQRDTEIWMQLNEYCEERLL